MNLNKNLGKINKEFQELWRYKIFRISIIIHIFYFILSQFLALTFFRYIIDFQVYYKAAELFLYNLKDLYTKGYVVPFRYFPVSAVLFIPFFLMGFDLGFIMFNLVNLILNFMICFFIYKIVLLIKREDQEKKEKDLIGFICIFLLSLPNIFNYILGQINLYITLLILMSLFIFLKYEEIKWNLLASFILGLSIIIKPTSFLLTPFLIICRFDLEKRKILFDFYKSLIRFIGVMTPIVFSSILFIIYPSLWGGFLDANFTGLNPIAESFSFSISQLITNFFFFFNIQFNQIFVLILIFIIIGGFGYIIFIIRKFENNSILYGYVIGILITLLVYFDSWDHHLLTIIPLLIIVFFDLSHYPQIGGFIKSSLIFLSFFSLLFTGIWCCIYPIFPYNFETTIFLILTFYGISKYCLIIVEKKLKEN